jgi:hypothetical protein
MTLDETPGCFVNTGQDLPRWLSSQCLRIAGRHNGRQGPHVRVPDTPGSTGRSCPPTIVTVDRTMTETDGGWTKVGTIILASGDGYRRVQEYLQFKEIGSVIAKEAAKRSSTS